MELARIAGRLAAAVLALIGVVIGLVVNFTYSLTNDAATAFGAKLPASHGFIGFGLLIFSFIGAVIALFRPRTAATLMLIGGAGFFYPVGWFALIASPFMLLGALLAFIDKGPSAKTTTPTKSA